MRAFSYNKRLAAYQVTRQLDHVKTARHAQCIMSQLPPIIRPLKSLMDDIFEECI